MMNEETYLKERVGKENPFRVPDGYFDTLASQVMARIDAEAQPQKKAKVISMHRVFYYAAAAVCALTMVSCRKDDDAIKWFVDNKLDIFILFIRTIHDILLFQSWDSSDVHRMRRS